MILTCCGAENLDRTRMSSLERELIRASLERFCNEVRILMPLRHLSEHNDEARIRDVTQQEAGKGCVFLMQKLNEASSIINLDRPGALVDEFCFHLKRMVDTCIEVNKECKTKWVSILDHRTDNLSEDLRTMLEAKVYMNPDMDPQSVESLFEEGKLSVMSYFQQMWKYGNADTFEEQEKKLEDKLNDLKMELLEGRHPQCKAEQDANQNWYEGKDATRSTKNFLESDSDSDRSEDKNIIVSNQEARQDNLKGASVIISTTSSAAVFVPDVNESLTLTLIKAIYMGQSVESIQKKLDAGANVNAKTRDGYNTAHVVIVALNDKRITSSDALAILSLLVTKGFKLINQKTETGYTPLFLAMEFKGLDEVLVGWFRENGADFNAIENEYGNSVLMNAIMHGHEAGLIRKILEFGANPKYVNDMDDSALHIAAYCAHDAVLEIFIDQLDVNGVNKDNSTPLCLLFMRENLDYQRCLEFLLGKGANLNGSCDKKCPNTLVHWLKHGKCNPFPTLVEAKDRLPITEEIASATLTTILEDIVYLAKYPLSFSQQERDAFVQFTTFLIEEKNAKLIPRGEKNWKVRIRGDLEKILRRDDFITKLKNSGGIKWKGALVRIKSASLVKFVFVSDYGGRIVSVPTEVVLGCLLACGNYDGFVTVCLFLRMTQNEYDVWGKGKSCRCVVQ